MKTLLLIHSSGRITRSITRRLGKRFAEKWLEHNRDSRVVERDLTAYPPPFVNESWISAAFAESQPRKTPEALRVSETLIEEILQADLIVLGAPMYNFGIPAQLKAYLDQIVRPGRTFAFESGTPEPYRPLIPSRPVVVITPAGDGDLHPGGPLAHMNHLEPYLITALGFNGLTDLHFIRAGYDEFQDDRAKRSLATAESEVDAMVEMLSRVEVVSDI